mmetsp:Transcript_15402/g.27176  ORF Transcript_15402/g.27176 Transcript_15402/m.27176 type:complete len:177 (+) Transcript_15402:2-532(+)
MRDEFPPADAHQRCSSRVHLLLSALAPLGAGAPFLQRRVVSKFSTRGDLIDACLCSVQIPFFLTRGATLPLPAGIDAASRRGVVGVLNRCIDGSVLPAPWELYNPVSTGASPEMWIDHKTDPGMAKRAFLELKPSVDGVRELMAMGKESATERRDSGALGEVLGGFKARESTVVCV